MIAPHGQPCAECCAGKGRGKQGRPIGHVLNALLSGDCWVVVGYGVPMGSGRVARFCAQTKFVLTGIGDFCRMRVG